MILDVSEIGLYPKNGNIARTNDEAPVDSELPYFQPALLPYPEKKVVVSTSKKWRWLLPSGKLTFCYGKFHHFSWENPL